MSGLRKNFGNEFASEATTVGSKVTRVSTRLVGEGAALPLNPNPLDFESTRNFWEAV